MPKEIAGLAADMLKDPVQARVAPVAAAAERVEQHVFLVDGGAKRDFLANLLANPEFSRAIVFTRTKRGADRVAQHLETAGVGAAAIHGNKSQSQRERALDGFRRGRTRVLVATDIAARGIDVDGVTHVVNFELPEVPEAYVHRIGRTARAGAAGRAISLCDNGERDLLRAIEKLTRQTLPFTDRRTSGAAQDEAPARRAPNQQLRQRPQGRQEQPRAAQRPTRARPQGQANGAEAPRRETSFAGKQKRQP
jgi:ATP-dependent RNA helicase RhlE